jgi:hypothetical protein
MAIVDYTRKAGRQLTYRIRADELGRYTVHLGGKQLLRGRAIAEAEQAIENLSLMDEC